MIGVVKQKRSRGKRMVWGRSFLHIGIDNKPRDPGRCESEGCPDDWDRKGMQTFLGSVKENWQCPSWRAIGNHYCSSEWYDRIATSWGLLGWPCKDFVRGFQGPRGGKGGNHCILPGRASGFLFIPGLCFLFNGVDTGSSACQTKSPSPSYILIQGQSLSVYCWLWRYRKLKTHAERKMTRTLEPVSGGLCFYFRMDGDDIDWSGEIFRRRRRMGRRKRIFLLCLAH